MQRIVSLMCVKEWAPYNDPDCDFAYGPAWIIYSFDNIPNRINFPLVIIRLVP